MSRLKDGKLTARQLRFIEEYPIDNYAKASAIRAGFAPKGANHQGFRLLQNRAIQEGITKIRAQRERRTNITLDRVLEEVYGLAMADPRKAFDDFNALLPVKQWPDDVALCIASIEILETRDAEGNTVGQTKKIRFWDKNSAIDKLMKHLGAYDMDNRQKNPLANVSRETLMLLRDNLLNAAKS
jgi:phage terminase small subunit